MPVTNKRREERFDLRLPAHISTVKKNRPNNDLFLVTVNVSSKGAYFETPQSLPVGREVKVKLQFPPKTTHGAGFLVGQVTVTGTVIRSSDGGIAISFNDDFRMSSQRVGFENN